MLNTLFSRPIVGTAVAVALLVIVSVADYLSGPDVAFSLFYFLIVALAAWATRDLKLALAGAVAGAVAWLIADWLTLGAPGAAILLWNAATRLAILITIGLLISRLRRALETEKALARTDFLTGVLNSRAFSELAEAEVARARRFAHPLAVVYIDLDNFKGVNDQLGHGHGDGVLREVARVLRDNVRQTDAVARIGGDEFVLLLPETTRRDAETVLEKLRHALTGAMEASASAAVTFSVGVAAYTRPPADVNLLIRAADTMMYKAKAEGKNCVRIDSDS